MMRLSNNISLPMLPLFAARSTWAMVFATLITVFSALGIDLLGFFTSIGAGSTPDEVLATGQRVVSAWQIVAPLAFGFWAWIERRAPNFRLTLGKPAAPHYGLGIGAVLLGICLMIGAGGELRAQPMTEARCFTPSELKQSLSDRYGEVVAGYGVTASDVPTFIFANPSTGSWTLVMLMSDEACVLMVGQDWSTGSSPPPGDPA